MADAPTLSPEVARSVSALARSLVAAARGWALYPPDHPAVRAALERLRSAIHDARGGAVFAFAVTPETLLVAGIAVGGRDATTVAEAARWLHDRDVLALTFAADVSVPVLQRLLALLSDDPRATRQRGGPAQVWAAEGDRAIAIEQIDLSHVLQDPEPVSAVRRKDDLWRAIVRGVLDRRRPADGPAQARLLEISGDVQAIGELAADVAAPHHSIDGSPMLTSQAAAVAAAYHHLYSIVDVMSPERKQEVLGNLAAATTSLTPQLAMQLLSGPAVVEAGADSNRSALIAGIAGAMDEAWVANLLAAALAFEGHASERLATVFNTIAPDEDRKQRVLTMTRRLLGETEFGRQDAFSTLWSSMEELLLSYNERPFVSAAYRGSLDGVGARAERMAADVPPELTELLDTLGQDNVRRLSVRLLIDLLSLETDAARASDLAVDVAALAEDLLLAGDYESALTVVTALHAQVADPAAIAHQSSRVALDTLAGTMAFREAAALLDEMSDGEASQFADVCSRIGPAAADALQPHLELEDRTAGRVRASAIVRGYGARAVPRLGSLAASTQWAARRNAADLLGEIGAADGVPLLQALLRSQDARVIAAAVRALASIKDPAAARAIHTVLRATSGDQRRAVVEALVGERDPRVVPVLVRIIEESDPFGADHPIVIESAGALRQVGNDQAVPALAALMRRKRLFARRKTRALKESGLAALRAIGTPAARAAIDDAARTGDRVLRRLARAHA